jgi:colanic acid biosynthesis glycosyl transferase WcaI
VVVMGNQYVGIVHPCKIHNVLAVKKPFLYIGPNESHVTDIVGQADAYVSSHGDVAGVVLNILRAMQNAPPVSHGAQIEELFSKDRLVLQMIRAIERSDWHARLCAVAARPNEVRHLQRLCLLD